MGEKQYSAEDVSAAAFAKRVDDDADAQGWTADDTLRFWYGLLEFSEDLVAEMGKKYAAGRRMLSKARLVIGNRGVFATCEAQAHRASVVRRCPDSTILSVSAGHRANADCIRHLGLRTRKEKKPKS